MSNTGQGRIRAAKNRARWKEIVLKSSVVPTRPVRLWERKEYLYYEQVQHTSIYTFRAAWIDSL